MQISLRLPTLVLVLIPACAEEPVDDARDPVAILEAKAGTYEGSWQLWGLDSALQVVEMVSWTDLAIADQPTLEDTRAYLHVTDTATFPDGTGFEQSWIEGVLLDEDGLAGDEFIEMNGIVTIIVEVAPDRYRYEQELGPQDFFSLGPVTPQNLTAGQHVVDKTVSFPDGIETHDIVRTTHLEWTDATGEHMLEFQSLVGQHRKTQ